MGEKLLKKYDGLKKELRTEKFKTGLAAFLADPKLTEDKLREMVADYEARLNDEYVRKPNDTWLDFIWGYEKDGTVHGRMTREEVLELARESKRKTYL